MGFRRWLLEKWPQKFNSDDDLLKVKSLFVSRFEFDDCIFDSIKGIEYFPNLELLHFSEDLIPLHLCEDIDDFPNAFSTIDLRQNKKLNSIEIQSSTACIYADGLPFLKNICLECPWLEEFTFDTLQVDCLDLRQFQGITSIDGNKYPNLWSLSLECCDNLTAITFKESCKLQSVSCDYNDNLDQLDLSGCPKLMGLGVYGCKKLSRVLLHPQVRNPTITADLAQWQTLDIILLPQDLITALALPEEPNDYMLLHQTRKIKT